MKRILNNRTSLIIDIIMYSIILVIGYILLLFSDINESSQTPMYVYTSLYVLSFFSIIAYSLVRKERKYYYLLLSLLSIVFATIIMVGCDTTKYTLYNLAFAEIVISYTIFNAVMDIIDIKTLNKPKLYVKVPIILVSLVVGIIITTVIYSKMFLSLYIMSYYFIALGLFKILETCMYVLIDGPTINKRINKEKEEIKKEKPKIKELRKRKPRVKSKGSVSK